MDYSTEHDFELLATNVEATKTTGQKCIEFQVRVIRSIAGQSPISVPTGYDAVSMHRQLQALETHALDWDGVVRLGTWLGEILFPQPVSELLLRSLERLNSKQEGLRLRLHLDGILNNIPWEFVLLNRGGGEATRMDLLGLLPNVSIVRHQAAALPAWSVQAQAKSRLVVGLASPGGYAGLNLKQEQQVIEQAVAQNPGIEATFIPNVTREQLLNALPHTHLFHFAGHGDFRGHMGSQPGTTEGEGYLVFDDGYGDPSLVEAGELALHLRQGGVRVAVLGACQSGRRDDVNVWSSVAAALLKADLGAVVGMQYTIRDASATAFADAFYSALLTGLPIDEAMTHGRLAVAVTDPRDWGVPVLYLRARDGMVFPEQAAKSMLTDAREQLRIIARQHITELHGKATVVKIAQMTHGEIYALQSIGEVAPTGTAVVVEIGELS